MSGDILVVIVGILVELGLSSVEIRGIREELLKGLDMHVELETLLSSASWLHFEEEKHSWAMKLHVAEMMFLVDSLVAVVEEQVGILR